MGQEFNGHIKVEIDEKALSAILHYTPDDKGEKHNIDTLRQILQKQNIVYGINEVALKDAVEDFSEALDVTVSDPVAEGEAPSSGEGEVYEFSSMDYPPELEAVAEKIRSLNKAPQIFNTITVTVKKDRRVKDKGLFKGGKEKIITVEEEVTRKVRVDVSGVIRGIGFIQQGNSICTINKSTGSEASGKDIHGNELKPLPVSKGKYYSGRFIRKEKNEFIAEECGFVRIGENWMDLIPFATHVWSVEVSENSADCFLSITAGHKAAPLPTVNAVKNKIIQLGYPVENLQSDEKISRLIRQGCQSEGGQTFCLTRDRDSESDIEINSLATEANLHLKKGSGRGNKLDLKKIWMKVLALKIKDFESERVKKEILDFNSSKELEISILLGKGEDPERGKERDLIVDTDYIEQGQMEFILERMEHLKKKPDSFQEFPMAAIEKMALVKKGTAIFHLGKQSEGRNGRDIFGNTIKGIEGNDPVVRLYENIVIQEGRAISTIDGILDYSSKAGVFSLRIRKHSDARIIVSVAENRMSASLSIIPPDGSGCLPTKESLIQALEEKGVVKGISDDILNAVLEKTGKEELVTDQVVAEGLIPFEEKAALRFLVNIKIGSSNSIPVEAGDPIAFIISGEGDELIGFDVFGEKLIEEDKSLTIDDHIKKEENEEGIKLVAAEKGLLVLEDNKLYIRNKYTIQGDVSRTDGNIKFPGTIEIIGSVLSGIFINAGGDLKVRDIVEASLLSSGGSILIGKGVKGDRKAVLRANNTINLGFAENTNLMSNGNIIYKKALMNCQVKCNSKIVSQGENARIIGGKIKAKNGLTADSIGSERGAPTSISFGQDYLVEDQINVMTKEIEQINEQLESLESMMKTAEHKGQQKKLIALRKKKFHLLKVQEKKVVKNFLMKDKFELHFDSEIRVNGTIYQGTEFESHGRKLKINESMTSVIVFFDSKTGKITTKQI